MEQSKIEEIRAANIEHVNQVRGILNGSGYRSGKRLLEIEAKEVMKMPTSKRNGYYAEVKRARGIKEAVDLVAEVRKHRQISEEMEI